MSDNHSYEFYIYSFDYEEKDNDTNSNSQKWATVIFCPNSSIDNTALKDDLKEYYMTHRLADDTIIIAGKYMEENVKSVFIDSKDTFDRANGYTDDYLQNHVKIYLFDVAGKYTKPKSGGQNNVTETDNKLLKVALNVGMTKIFTRRGGLVKSLPSHHYIFPSGKHSDQFLRTGNILLHSHEILFVASCLLSFIGDKVVTKILCDTSSINTIAFAINELRQRFKIRNAFLSIESFNSYDGLEKRKKRFNDHDFVLISASTSCDIITRIKEVHYISENNIVILFYINNDSSTRLFQNRIACNLTYNEKENIDGINSYITAKNSEECTLCRRGSAPIKIWGDVFLLEGPKVENHIINKDDVPLGISEFMDRYRSKSGLSSVFISHFKEARATTSDEVYDVYLNIEAIIDSSNDDFVKKLNRNIDLHIPANTKYIVHLEDDASVKLAKYIEDKLLKIIQNSITLIPRTCLEEQGLLDGSVLVVASSLIRGRNLLLISQELRRFSNISIAYLIGFVRTKNKTEFDFIKSNLGYGKHGINTNPLYEIETFYCTDEQINTTWKDEIMFLENLKSVLPVVLQTKLDALKPKSKENNLFDLEANLKNGLIEDLFYPNFSNQKPLELGNNFAFVKFDYTSSKLKQSEVYFIMSAVLNNLRNKKLIQTPYVRNLISPANFYRYNEGIIQASILRAATAEELYYELDEECSLKMKDLLINMIRHPKNQGDGLLEFLFAIASRKLTLSKKHLKVICDKIDEKYGKNELLTPFISEIRYNILKT